MTDEEIAKEVAEKFMSALYEATELILLVLGHGKDLNGKTKIEK